MDIINFKIRNYNDERLQNALFICSRLDAYNFKAYLVGGCVRDLYLGITPKDYDIVTNATPNDIKQCFLYTYDVGIKFGIIVVLINGVSYEVATFRSDGLYSDGRRPNDVTFSNEYEDSQRRDFTINGLFYDPFKEIIIDYVDGIRDINSGKITTIGDPIKRFSEDYLRMLRAIRFSSRFNFKIDGNATNAIIERSEFIKSISSERINDELTKILLGKNPHIALELMRTTKLLDHILPEVIDMIGVEQPVQFHPEGDVYKHTLIMLKNMNTSSKILAFSVLLHDVGKPSTYTVTDRIRFSGHDEAGAKIATDICSRLKMSNKEIEGVTFLVENHMKMHHFTDMKKSKRYKLMSNELFPLLLELYKLDCISRSLVKDEETLGIINEEYKQFLNRPIKPVPIIGGKDLISLGYKPGKIFSDILNYIDEEIIEGNINDKETAMKKVKEKWPI